MQFAPATVIMMIKKEERLAWLGNQVLALSELLSHHLLRRKPAKMKAKDKLSNHKNKDSASVPTPPPTASQVIENLSALVERTGCYPESATFHTPEEESRYYNTWADYWRYVVGVNAIPANTRIKKTFINWQRYQNSQIPEKQHIRWKDENAFNDGIAVIAGKVWHRLDRVGLYFVIIDADKVKAIEELCTINGKLITLEEMARRFLVEQHTDDKDRAHFYFYSPIPLVGKSTDAVIGIEVKSLGEHGISYCCPSFHMNKNSEDKGEYRYEIIGESLHEPVSLTVEQAREMIRHINRVCIKYGVEYLDKDSRINRLKPMLHSLAIDKSIRIFEGERHVTLLSAADSLLIRYLGNAKSEESLRTFFMEINKTLCDPEPLPQDEIEGIWESAIGFAKKVKPITETNSVTPELLSVSLALRRKNGYVKVPGQLIGQSSVYNMISAIKLSCDVCKLKKTIDYGKKPISRPPYKEFSQCYSCNEVRGLTLKAEPEYITTIDVELQDPEKFSEIERISVKLFERNTEKIIVGENVTITGHLHVVRKNDNPQNRPVTTLFAESVEYTRKELTALTKEDIEEIENWKRTKENEGANIIDELVSMLAPEVIGNEHVKEGLLMVAANAGIRNERKRIPRRLRLHQLLIGDPSLAKSTLLQAVARTVPNGRYESCQSSTGLSLTAQVSKEEGGSYVLRAGPIPQAKDSLCALNEIGQMPISDHKHFLDFMEEGEATLNKYGFNAKIAGHTSIVASANPINNTWKDSGIIDFSEFPTLVQIIHRFDFISVFREITDEKQLREYTRKRAEIAKKFESGSFDDWEEFMRKYIMRVRTFQPIISEEAKEALNEFWVKMAAAGVRGLPRKLDSLERAAIARAKLKLKNVVDAEDAVEATQYFNIMLSHFAQTVVLPRDVSLTEIRLVIKELNGIPIAYVEAARKACERNQQVKYYLGDKLELSKNSKLANILTLLRKDPSIQLVSEKPVILRWAGTDNSGEDQRRSQHSISQDSNATQSNESYIDTEQGSRKINHSSEVSEIYDVEETPPPLDTEKETDYDHNGDPAGVQSSASYTSYTSDKRYIPTINSSTSKTYDGFFPSNLMHDPNKVLDGMLVLRCDLCGRYKTPIPYDMRVHLLREHQDELIKSSPRSSMNHRLTRSIEKMKKKEPVEYYDSKTAKFGQKLSNIQKPKAEQMNKDKLLNEWFSNDIDDLGLSYHKKWRLEDNKSMLIQNSVDLRDVHPFVKWAGGKGQLLHELNKMIPSQFSTYFEPFLGGGAMFFNLVSRGMKFNNAYLSDANIELITAYNVIKVNPKGVIEFLQRYDIEYKGYQPYSKEQKAYYKRLRDVFNKKEFSDDVERAAMFIMLIRTGFNGLWRENKEGECNVPPGKYMNPLICDRSNLESVSNALRYSKAVIHVADYKNVLLNAKKDDFIYLDPPYHPVSSTADFTSYTNYGFCNNDQSDLAKIFVDLNNRGCKVLLSSSDTPFIRRLYSEDYVARAVKAIKEVNVSRSINSNASRRKGHKELLISNYTQGR